MYIHERKDWPNFTWRETDIVIPLADVRYKQGRLIGKMEALGFDLRTEATLQILTDDVVKSSEIEGENLDKLQVRSSIARQLGIDIAGLVPSERHVDGVVEMMLDATQNFHLNLTKERLFAWHGALFPTGYSGLEKITVGDWRKDERGPMQVVSGAFGKEVIHYEAPEASLISNEMNTFLNWFDFPPYGDPVINAAIAHLWFVTVHPFEDGNGRIARAIADMGLARCENSARRFYSVSSQIREKRKSYYAELESTQKGDLDITNWVLWFIYCMKSALEGAEKTLENVLYKASFWKLHEGKITNERQRVVINRLLVNFKGNLTTSKWAKLAKCSQDTALRDINDLVEKNLLVKGPSSGRSTHYILNPIG